MNATNRPSPNRTTRPIEAALREMAPDAMRARVTLGMEHR